MQNEKYIVEVFISLFNILILELLLLDNHMISEFDLLIVDIFNLQANDIICQEYLTLSKFMSKIYQFNFCCCLDF